MTKNTSADYKKQYERWMDSPALSEEEWQELSAISGDEREIESRFHAPLEFGTAGLRGIMGMGTSRMNIHTVRHATQAFADVIGREGGEAKRRGVVICYDCRDQSDMFAREAASVMAANGVYVKIFESLRPTPELSFAIRYHHAVAGMNITASHNPKEYNGYKVYWSDGAQIPPPHAKNVAITMGRTDIFSDIARIDYQDAVSQGLISELGAETDEAFLEKVMEQSVNPEAVGPVAGRLKIVYTPFHGAGHELVPKALERLGVTRVIPVPEQMIPDGSFPTVESPNPENPEGFELAIKLADKEGADLIIGTDPDSDRIGVMARGKSGEFVPISGNQLGVLLLDYVIKARKSKGTLPENAAAIKTIVTTEMAREVCEKNGVHMDDTFTGFKFMAEKLAEYEESGRYRFVMAYEESYGYMIGDFVRDKDAVTASMLTAEMAAWYLGQEMSLLDAMEKLYGEYGSFGERTLNLVMPGLDGLGKMRSLMEELRTNPPTEIGGEKVVRVRDYLTGKIAVSGLGKVGSTHINGSDVLYFELYDGTAFIVRPSGTEPKIKVYILARGTDLQECAGKIARCEAYAEGLKDI